MDFHKTWYVHWYCDLLWDYWWENFVYFWQSYLPTIHPYFHFWTITLENINGVSPNLICALILWRSALGLLMGQFLLFLTELSAPNTSVFYFQKLTDLDLHCVQIQDICRFSRTRVKAPSKIAGLHSAVGSASDGRLNGLKFEFQLSHITFVEINHGIISAVISSPSASCQLLAKVWVCMVKWE